MRVHVADHPLITHKLTVLRDERTPSPMFRQLAEELVTLLAYEATRGVRVSPVEITTPVTTTMGVRISEPRPLVVPILRAGLAVAIRGSPQTGDSPRDRGKVRSPQGSVPVNDRGGGLKARSTASATENIPPTRLRPEVRVKWCGKSAPRAG